MGWKSKIKKMSPGIGLKVLGQREEDREASDKRQEAREGASSAASLAELQRQLGDSEKEYHGLPTSLLKQYTENSRRAGTYANTDEFNTGLQSDVQGGLRGARISQAARINALRSRLGMEAFDANKDASAGAAVKNAVSEWGYAAPGAPLAPGAAAPEGTAELAPPPVEQLEGGEAVLPEAPQTELTAQERLRLSKLQAYQQG